MSDIFLLFLGTFVFVGLLVMNTKCLRYLIYLYAFNGMSKSAIKTVKMEQSRRNRVFLTYVLKCNKTKYRCFGRPLWCLICHYVNVVAAIFAILLLWIEFIFLTAFGVEANFTAFFGRINIAYDDILDALLFIMLFTIPFCCVVIPFLPMKKKKKNSY